MEELINIDGQQFYYSTIDQVVERCSKKEKCAIIIDESHLDDLLSKGMDIIGECVDQIIIISENVNLALEQLKDKDVLLLSAKNLKQAIQYAILSTELNNEVICIPKEGKDETSEIIELILV
jgi:hypothetical protein